MGNAPATMKGLPDSPAEEKADDSFTMQNIMEDLRLVQWEGYVEKQSEVLKQWRQRYFVLEGRVLYYYASKQQAMDKRTNRGQLYITNAYAEDYAAPNPNARPLYGFAVELSSKKVLHCATYGEFERSAWVQWMQIAISASKAERLEAESALSEVFQSMKAAYDQFSPEERREKLTAHFLKEALCSRKLCMELLPLVNREIVLKQNYPKSLPFSGTFNGREGLVCFFELWTGNLHQKDLALKLKKCKDNELLYEGKETIFLEQVTVQGPKLIETEQRFDLLVTVDPFGLPLIVEKVVGPDLIQSIWQNSLVTGRCTYNPYSHAREGINPAFHTPVDIQSFKTRRTLSLTMADFEPIRLIGRGSFGMVILARRKRDKKLYAIKVIDKTRLDEDSISRLETETLVGMYSRHPYLCGVQFAFHSPTKIFLGMKFYCGGDLRYHIYHEDQNSSARSLLRGSLFSNSKNVVKNGLELDRVRLYTAEVVLALIDLHSRGIIFRDLKPSNIMIDNDGHIALVDFGLSKCNVKFLTGAQTFAGSAYYLAPELLASDWERRLYGYGYAADWWSLGILLYEMYYGTPPFYHENNQDVFKAILERQVIFPADDPGPAELQDLVKQLLVKDPKERLGRITRKVLDHPFFADINWEELLESKVTAPWIPSMKSEDSADYISKQKYRAGDRRMLRGEKRKNERKRAESTRPSGRSAIEMEAEDESKYRMFNFDTALKKPENDYDPFIENPQDFNEVETINGDVASLRQSHLFSPSHSLALPSPTYSLSAFKEPEQDPPSGGRARKARPQSVSGLDRRTSDLTVASEGVVSEGGDREKPGGKKKPWSSVGQSLKKFSLPFQRKRRHSPAPAGQSATPHSPYFPQTPSAEASKVSPAAKPISFDDLPPSDLTSILYPERRSSRALTPPALPTSAPGDASKDKHSEADPSDRMKGLLFTLNEANDAANRLRAFSEHYAQLYGDQITATDDRTTVSTQHKRAPVYPENGKKTDMAGEENGTALAYQQMGLLNLQEA